MSESPVSSVSPGSIQSDPIIYTRDQHSISRAAIDPDALKIMYRLIKCGHKAYLVGGGVRDLLLGKTPKDFDISTDATPRRIKEIFRNSRIIGRRFKLVHIFFKGRKIIEVSTFRDVTDPIDIEDEEVVEEPTTLRHDNKYGTEVTDAVRRDITINGLFYDPSTFSVIDYVGGVQDLQSGIVRVIGDPDIRFKEDPVRMVRVVRHAIRSGFSIDEKCWASLIKHKELICEVPPVRIYEEMKKDFASGHCFDILGLLYECGLLHYLLPEMEERGGILLDSKSDLAKVLGEVDRRKDDSPISPTVVLAIIALFSGAIETSIEALRERFEGLKDLREHLQECFPELAVPRKERERIEAILNDWISVVRTNDAQVRSSQFTRNFARKGHLDDLISFCEILPARDPEQVDIPRILRSAKERTPAGRESEGRARRREQHGHSQTRRKRTGYRGIM